MNLLCAILLIAGATSCLLGSLGLLRFPDLLSRLQAATKPQTLGLLLILLGTAVRLDVEDVATLGLVALFQVLTAPVISQLIGRSAYRSGSMRRDLLVVDELGTQLPRKEADREEPDLTPPPTPCARPPAPGPRPGRTAGRSRGQD